jgi:hypothetical protein
MYDFTVVLVVIIAFFLRFWGVHFDLLKLISYFSIFLGNYWGTCLFMDNICHFLEF